MTDRMADVFHGRLPFCCLVNVGYVLEKTGKTGNSLLYYLYLLNAAEEKTRWCVDIVDCSVGLPSLTWKTDQKTKEAYT